jgi:hypothetical protein
MHDASAILGLEKLTVVDLCCGEYAWLPRHFADRCSVIYAIDKEPHATRAASQLSANVKEMVGEGLEQLMQLATHKTDFIYCGFNMYEHFVPGVRLALREQGSFFLMKPITGDDIQLRGMFTGHSMNERRSEVNRISAKLGMFSDLDYSVEHYSWSFNTASLDHLLAALSIVCFGGEIGRKKPLDEPDYERGIHFLENRTENNTTVLRQEIAIWRGTAHG